MTIVSCYYLLPNNKKRSIEEYMYWISTFLTHCTSPIVMFSDGPIADQMDSFRKARGLPWLLVRTPINHLYFGSEAELAYMEERARGRTITPEVIRIWLNKSHLLSKVAKLNPFNTDSFVWCDAGCWRDENFAKVYAPGWPKSPPKALTSSWIGKMEDIRSNTPDTQSTLEEFVAHYMPLLLNRPAFTGAIFGGNTEAITNFKEIFTKIFEICRSQNIPIDGDQEICGITSLWMESKGMLTKFYDETSLIPGTDNWFMLQSLL
jgi:hypothetical protein